jgi:glutaredoxin
MPSPAAPDSRGLPQVVLYGKPGCHLCDDARAQIESIRRRRQFELREVDISIDPTLMRRYGERIPVVEVDGQEAFELGVDGALLERLLDR